MIDTKELRRLAQVATKGPWRVDEVGVGFEIAAGDNVVAQAQSIPRDNVQHTARRANAAFIAAANPAAIFELLDRLEAAESDAAHQKALADSALRVAEGWERKCDTLRAKIAEMEQQEPVALVESWTNGSYGRNYKLQWLRDVNEGAKLHALPGAQPAPSVPEGFSREDLEAVADGLDGYEKTVNVGNVTGEGDDHLESTTAYAARFIHAMLAASETKP